MIFYTHTLLEHVLCASYCIKSHMLLPSKKHIFTDGKSSAEVLSHLLAKLGLEAVSVTLDSHNCLILKCAEYKMQPLILGLKFKIK
jgi:hypothetical protein